MRNIGKEIFAALIGLLHYAYDLQVVLAVTPPAVYGVAEYQSRYHYHRKVHNQPGPFKSSKGFKAYGFCDQYMPAYDQHVINIEKVDDEILIHQNKEHHRHQKEKRYVK